LFACKERIKNGGEGGRGNAGDNRSKKRKKGKMSAKDGDRHFAKGTKQILKYLGRRIHMVASEPQLIIKEEKERKTELERLPPTTVRSVYCSRRRETNHLRIKWGREFQAETTASAAAQP